jgi:hypothetical protein
VLRPLQQLLDTFTGPSRLIQKRNDKLLDFAAASQKRNDASAATPAAGGQKPDKSRDLGRPKTVSSSYPDYELL